MSMLRSRIFFFFIIGALRSADNSEVFDTSLPAEITEIREMKCYPNFYGETKMRELNVWDAKQVVVLNTLKAVAFTTIITKLHQYFQGMHRQKQPDYTMFEVDPILSYFRGEKKYLSLRNVYSYDLHKYKDPKLHIQAKAEVSVGKEPDLKNEKRSRKDFHWIYTIECAFDEVNLVSDFELKTESGDVNAHGILKIYLKKLKVHFVIVIKAIDEGGKFRVEDVGVQNCAPDFTIKYELEELTTSSTLKSDPESPGHLSEEEVNGFLNSIRNQILFNKIQTEERIFATLLPKLTPKIMAMESKLLLPNVIEEVLANNSQEGIVSDKKIQEVQTTFPTYSCARELVMKMLLCGIEKICEALQHFLPSK